MPPAVRNPQQLEILPGVIYPRIDRDNPLLRSVRRVCHVNERRLLSTVPLEPHGVEFFCEPFRVVPAVSDHVRELAEPEIPYCVVVSFLGILTRDVPLAVYSRYNLEDVRKRLVSSRGCASLIERLHTLRIEPDE